MQFTSHRLQQPCAFLLPSSLGGSSQTDGKSDSRFTDITPRNAFPLVLRHELFSFIYTECVFSQLGRAWDSHPYVGSLCSVVFSAWKLLRSPGSCVCKSNRISISPERCCLGTWDAVGSVLSASLGIRPLRLGENRPPVALSTVSRSLPGSSVEVVCFLLLFCGTVKVGHELLDKMRDV